MSLIGASIANIENEHNYGKPIGVYITAETFSPLYIRLERQIFLDVVDNEQLSNYLSHNRVSLLLRIIKVW